MAKYKGDNKDVKLVDLVNIVHPVPTMRNKEALELLIKGELKNTQTWESKLSLAGQMAESEEDLTKLKSDAWSELISTRKL
jgi:60 kDa SS-A/Ro ribonucleoprotein